VEAAQLVVPCLRFFLDDPWHCRTPVIELRRDGEVERIELER
jgi:hypothetical protein